MPTHEEDSAFLRDYRRLSKAQKLLFLRMRNLMIGDLREMESGDATWFRDGLVHKLRGVHGLYELRWAENGRAIFSFGIQQQSGLLHICWHRCGTHDILP